MYLCFVFLLLLFQMYCRLVIKKETTTFNNNNNGTAEDEEQQICFNQIQHLDILISLHAISTSKLVIKTNYILKLKQKIKDFVVVVVVVSHCSSTHDSGEQHLRSPCETQYISITNTTITCNRLTTSSSHIASSGNHNHMELSTSFKQTVFKEED